MKKIIILLSLVLLFSSCKEKNTTPKTEKIKQVKAENMDWLLGKWKRVNEKADKQTFENWNKNSNDEYIGIGFTMQNSDTISKESMLIHKKNKQWNLTVSVIGKGEDTSPVTFKISKIEKNSFTCVNAENDFPNKIQYFKEGDKINAIISGGDMEIPFEFERLDK